MSTLFPLVTPISYAGAPFFPAMVNFLGGEVVPGVGLLDEAAA